MVSGGSGNEKSEGGGEIVHHEKIGSDGKPRQLKIGPDGKEHYVPMQFHHEIRGYANKNSSQTEKIGHPFWHPSPKDMPEPPVHFQHNNVNLELYLGDPRQRLAGMTEAERSWRKKFVEDQNLSIDEPIYVPEFMANLNPFRRIYRIPWDYIEKRYLIPKFGFFSGHIMRVWAPKFVMIGLSFMTIYYYGKYHHQTWWDPERLSVMRVDTPYLREEEIREKAPGALEKGLRNYQHKLDYADFDFKYRHSHLKLDPPLRP